MNNINNEIITQESLLQEQSQLLQQHLKEAEKWTKKLATNKNYSKKEKVKLSECFARKQFYRQNGLPVELNMLIEEEVAQNWTNIFQKRLHYVIEREIPSNNLNIKQIETKLKELKIKQQEAEKEVEIQRILKQEIEDYQKQWQEYLNTKPLPELPQKQSKIKALGNKIKTQFQQVVKPRELPKPIKGSLFNALFITSLILKN